jgi:hypothetical protein
VTWRWTAWRIVISAYVAFHLTGTLLWLTPNSPLRQALVPVFQYYMIPLGLWQSWYMFAPDPMRTTLALESEVVDAQGMRHLFAFPKVADLPWWRKMPRFRHPKFSCNLLVDEFTLQREFTARHVVRQLGLPASAFPVHVSLYYQVKDLPVPGGPPADPMAPSRLLALGNYEFGTRDEVDP